MINKYQLLTGCFILLIFGCTYDSYEDLHPRPVSDTLSVSDSVKYGTDIKPIITSNCGTGDNNCHSSNPVFSGRDYTTYPGLKAVASTGQLVNAITHSSGSPAMPKGSPKLDESLINKIKKWVAQGALNN